MIKDVDVVTDFARLNVRMVSQQGSLSVHVADRL